MGSTVTLPVFEEREKLLHTKLNAAFQAIQAKFASGVSTADLSWPLTAEGFFDMSIYEIIHGRKIWGLVNAKEYDTLADAVSAAGSGGVVVVPPDTTVTSSGAVDISGLGGIIGFGPSSMIQFTSGAAATLLTAGSGTALLISNLTLDGNGETGTLIGLNLEGMTNVLIDNVWFQDFSSHELSIKTSNGVMLNNCHFVNGNSNQVYAERSGALMFNNVKMHGANGAAIYLDVTGVDHYTYVSLSNVTISSCTGNAVCLLGYGAPGATSPVDANLSNVVVTDSAGATAAVILGDATNALRHVTWSGGSISLSTNGGIAVNATNGDISGVLVDDPGSYGCSLGVSQYVTVHDCIFKSCTTGLDGSSVAVGSLCEGHHNKYVSCTTDVLYGPGFWPYGRNHVISHQNNTYLYHAGAGTTDTIATFTVPIHALKNGSVIEFSIGGVFGSNTASSYVAVLLDTATMGSAGCWTAGQGTSEGYRVRAVCKITGTTTWTKDTDAYVYNRPNQQAGAQTTGLNIAAAQPIYVKTLLQAGDGVSICGYTVNIYPPFDAE